MVRKVSAVRGRPFTLVKTKAAVSSPPFEIAAFSRGIDDVFHNLVFLFGEDFWAGCSFYS